MPPKVVKVSGGRLVTIKSIQLANGNLLVPRRNRELGIAEWVEVEPGTPDFKRWLPVAVAEPDPRQDDGRATRKGRSER